MATMGRPLKDRAKAALKTMLALTPDERARVLFALDAVAEAFDPLQMTAPRAVKRKAKAGTQMPGGQE